MGKIIDYCRYHKDNPPEEIQKPLKSTNLMECGVSEWDSEHVNIEQEVLFELILAANYLDIKSLLDLTCAKVASMIKVIDYCKYHKENPPEEIQKPLKSVNLIECGVSEWDAEYVNIEQEVLFELILAANYLDIKS